MKRTRPKGDPDPGWQRIGWDEALDVTAVNLRRLAEQHGPHSVVFSMVSASTSAIADSAPWIQRLMRAFGSPNLCGSMELCGWGRGGATRFTYGIGMGATGTHMPDLEHAGCMLFWGYNPSLARLSHATAAVAALRRGARLIVVDPRRVGLAGKADVWLRVRPGSDGALALGIANVMIEREWYDRPFVRDWTNGPLLVRSDNGRLLTERDLSAEGSARRYVAWDPAIRHPVLYDPSLRRYERDGVEPALFGEYKIATPDGEIACRPAFDLCAEVCRRYSAEVVEATCGVGRDQVEAAARLLWESRPVAYYAWSGLEQQSNATQIARAISLVYSLTGSFDAQGGNVLFPAVPTANVAGQELLSPEQRARALGLADRPLGPSREQWVTTDEMYRAILEQRPYAVRGLVGFGANLLLVHADVRRGREALAALDFYVHADLFMNPTAELADIVLPVASPFEREGLKVGFEVSAAAQSLVQLRRRVVEPHGEARSDTDIVFGLACRLGLVPLLGRRRRGGQPSLPRTVRGVARGAARAPGRSAGAPRDTLSQVRGAEGRRAESVRYADAEDRALFGDAAGARVPAAAGAPGAADRSALSTGPGRALSADPDLRQAHAVLRESAPRAAELAAACSGSGGGAAPGRRRRARHP